MKKKTLMLSCVATIISVAVVGTKTCEPQVFMSNNLLTQNVEALSQDEEPYPEERRKCIDSDGSWNMASVCDNSGFETATCKISGEISLFGVTIKGSYEKGSKYSIPWARYKCIESSGNCCKQQGLYSGGKKLA